MNYSKQLKDYQRIFEKSLKKRFKSIVRVEVDPSEFEDVMENKSTFNIFNVKIYWDVYVAVRENETLGGITPLGSEILKFMFNKYGGPWIDLIQIEKNED
jgi:hypothetical protein